MTVGSALEQGKRLLFYAEVETPLLDATVLLSEALGTSKERLLASLPDPVDEEDWRRYQGFLDQRCSGLPVSYIRKLKEFFSLEFYVDRRVLVPRPDTEILVEEALRVLELHPGMTRVHDACTGSGCVAIALKNALPRLEVSASDLEVGALEVAAFNARRLLGGSDPLPGWAGRRFRASGPIRLYRSDLLSRVPGNYDLITANPPYLSDGEVENMSKVGWPEPEVALRGGPDGRELLRRLIRQAPRKLRLPGYLLLEASPLQMEALEQELTAQGFVSVTVAEDLTGRKRVIRARR